MSEDKKKDFTDPPPPNFQQWADEDFCWFKYFWTLQEFLQTLANATNLKHKTLEYYYYKKNAEHDPHLYWCCQAWKELATIHDTLQPLSIDNRTLAQVKRPRKSKSSDSQGKPEETPAANAPDPTKETTKEETPEETYSTDEEN